jgi:hypothetical protein
MRRKPQPCRRGELVIVIGRSGLGRSADFWSGVLGYALAGTAVGTYQGLMPADDEGVEVLLQRVPEALR